MTTNNRSNFDTKLQRNPISLIRKGRYNHDIGNIAYLTDDGYYWQTKTNSITEAGTLLFYATRLSAQTSYPKGRGQSIRCLVR